MAGQFDLGSKHLECVKVAKEFISEVEANATSDRNPKEVIKQYLAKSFGKLPSDSQMYDDYLGMALATEEIAKQDSLSAYALVDQIIFREILKKYSELNAEDILNQDETISLLCLESGFSGVDAIQTKATKTADGWNLTGTKLISNEQLYSEKFLVFTKDEENKLRLFVIPEEQVRVEELEKNLANTKVVFNQINLNLNVSDNQNVATISDNFEAILTLARTLIASVSIGMAHSSLIKAIEVAKTTKNSTGEGLSNSQNIQFTLADMFSEVEAARMLMQYSADCIDKGAASIKMASMAKVKASEAASNVTMEAIHILGNVGFISDTTDFAPLVLRSALCRTKGGTNRVQRSEIYGYMLAKK